MGLFQKSVLKKYLKGIDEKQVNEAWERFKSHFHNSAIQENIRRSKEEQHQGEFLIDLFVKVLGYTNHPLENYNLIREQKNVKDAKSADGAIIKDGKIIAVIELKGTDTTNLANIETQAFGYKNNQPDAVYVITSNFEKLRFYIDNAVDSEDFNLFQLTKGEFQLLWVCLSKDSIFQGIPKQIKDESLSVEENVTNKLYKDYSAFRNDIFTDIVKNNPQYDKLTLFNKTQKLLDRFLFVLFAEDRLLLPPNSIWEIVNQWTDLRDKYDEYQPLYSRFIKYFGYLNTGHQGKKHDIFAYNGGLFLPDEILDSIKIDDTLLYKHTLNICSYDFESEVSVNILGHIFEHSISEIEEIQAELEGQVVEKDKTKRKKDGVFYTPKYVTKYIVDSTVGILCKHKKAELGIDEEKYNKDRKNRKKATLKELEIKLEKYRTWLLGLTICDPACGSGAFLNQALEFLINEHHYIDELNSKLFEREGENTLIFKDISNDILEKNLFGVDVNDESVEIAKLSLWLRTAQKGRKLTSLNNNIKCGNSLIDDKAVAGDKAFDWKNEFPEVFAKGGFDVIIGNPPYGAHLNDLEKTFIKRKYRSYQYKYETYLYFIEKGIYIINDTGVLSFITPELFLRLDTSESIRNYIKENSKLSLLRFYGEKVFKDVKVNAVVFVIWKTGAYDSIYIQSEAGKTWDIKYSQWEATELLKIEYTADSSEKEILDKIESQSNRLIQHGEVIQGITPYDSYRGQSPEIIKNRGYHFSYKKDDTCGKWLDGEGVSRYALSEGNEWLSYGEWLAAPREKRYFEGMRILFREVPGQAKRIQACMAKEVFYYGHSITPFKPFDSVSEAHLNIILALVNSRLINWYGRKKLPNFSKTTFPKINPKDVKELPILKGCDTKAALLAEYSKSMQEMNIKLNGDIQRFANLVKGEFGLGSLSNKLLGWPSLDWKVFETELKKHKVVLNLNQKSQWIGHFETSKKQILDLTLQKELIDQKIDQLVYQLYELTPDEIRIVEGQS